MSLLGWLAGLAITLGLAAVSGLISDEARARLERIPSALLLLAIRRLPPEIRADVGDEWRAELDHILHRVEAYPLTRLLSGIHFAAGLLQAAPRVGRDLITTRPSTGPGEPPPRPRQPRARKTEVAPRASGPRRWRTWRRPFGVMLASFVAVTVLLNWQIGIAVAVITAAGMAIRRLSSAAGPLRRGPAPPGGCPARATPRHLCLHARAVPGTGEIIDHLVIGPGGIYALDSQRWDRRLPARAKSDGQQLYHGPISRAGLLEQASQRAARAAELIAAELGTRITIQPGLVVYGPRLYCNAAPVRGAISLRGVDVFRPRETRAWLNSYPATLSAADVQHIAAAAARVLPQPPSLPGDARIHPVADTAR